MRSRPRDPSTLLAAVAMAGATCLLLAVALSVLATCRAPELPTLAGPHSTEVDIQLEPAALPGTPDLTQVDIAAPVRVTRSGAANPRESFARVELATFNGTAPPKRVDASPPSTASLSPTLAEVHEADHLASEPPIATTAASQGAPANDTTQGVGGGVNNDGSAKRSAARDSARAPATLEVIPFGAGMIPPRRLHGASPAYTAQALAARVQGRTAIRCIIDDTGSVHDCRILEPLPLLDEATRRALLASRFSPATFRGRPVSVSYLFTFDFRLP